MSQGVELARYLLKDRIRRLIAMKILSKLREGK